jgi:hypothetical protein
MSSSLNNIRIWMTRYLMSGYVSIGLLGNIINICIFTRKNSLQNSCALYLLALSIANIFNLSFAVIPTIYALDHVDLSTYSSIYCRLRLYFVHVAIMVARTLLVVACIDRYALCSNKLRLRSFSKAKVAIRVIFGTVLLWFCINTYIPFFQSLRGNTCGMVAPYALIWAIYTVIVPGILPPTAMSIFGVLAIRNRRQLQIRLNTRRRAGSKRDYTLLMMLLSEVFIYVITTILFPIITVYKAVTNGEIKSVERQQIESFISFLATPFLIYINPSSTFYIYILSSKNYRKECKQMFIDWYMRIIGRRNQVGTMATVNAQANQIETMEMVNAQANQFTITRP